MKADQYLRSLCHKPWAIHPPAMEELVAAAQARTRGAGKTLAELKAIATKRKKYSGINGSVAVLPLIGVIGHRYEDVYCYGGTPTREFGMAFDAAIADPQVGAILIDVDSYGGSVYGCDELATKISNARGAKPIVAVANAACFSAAYYLASQASELVVTPSGQVGSIGVLQAHYDLSAMNERMGFKVTYVHAGKYKVEGNIDEPLGDEARAEMQRHVDNYYDMFVAAVARGRGVNAKVVTRDFGEGRIVDAADAVARGMADRVAPFDQVLAELNAAKKPSTNGLRASVLRRRLALDASASGKKSLAVKRT